MGNNSQDVKIGVFSFRLFFSFFFSRINYLCFPFFFFCVASLVGNERARPGGLTGNWPGTIAAVVGSGSSSDGLSTSGDAVKKWESSTDVMPRGNPGDRVDEG